MKIDRDAFEEWQAHPITELLFKCCVEWAEQAKAHWVTASWDKGQSDPLFLAQMKERAIVFEQIRTLKAEQIEETLE